MTFRTLSPLQSAMLACCLAAIGPAAHADESGTTATTTTATTTTTSGAGTTVGTSTTTESKLANEFATFLGGTDQAGAVVTGLRQGTAFSLDGTNGAAGSTIDPPTGTMGYGNVRITLRLAQAELSSFGITQPTSDQLSAVLLGGSIDGTQVDGILTLRAEGMGWGQIAQKYGLTVGQIMGKGAGLTQSSRTTTTGTTSGARSGHTASATSSHTHANGYIPSSPKPTSATGARSNGYIPSGGKSATAGMVTAAGGSIEGVGETGGRGQGRSVVGASGDGGMASANGPHVSMAGGNKPMDPGRAGKN
ncbi:hypothetical protein [Thiobacillus sedimenti]|uniref:Uncharacterized protein n=1 Tax=Thiobacillus sedimenti TaxID=3110231 RepID=A0ABZ1CJ66_9PROT|nr:hypothetical protein [Thiobacillus sp. SCUT-2]WRS39433.1 hypothetical protein VA613_00780 [Thiobacillus sp. SCUT-2]